jgi:hypothetical protein
MMKSPIGFAGAIAVPQSAGLRSTRVAEDVIDRDDRTRIATTRDIPWRWICELLITFPDG